MTTIDYSKAPILSKLLNFTNAQKAELTKRITSACATLYRVHLHQYSSTHHGSASRLGVAPTGIIDKAADEMVVTDNSITISLPFINKAFHALDITPKSSKWLTIPVHKDSAHKTLSQVIAMGCKPFKPKGHNVIMGYTTNPKSPVPLFALSKHVVIPQDRSLLPGDAAINTTLLDETHRYIFES